MPEGWGKIALLLLLTIGLLVFGNAVATRGAELLDAALAGAALRAELAPESLAFALLAFAASCLVFAVLLWLAWEYGSEFIQSTARMTTGDEASKRVLIMGLSPITRDPEGETRQKTVAEAESGHARLEDVAKNVADYDKLRDDKKPLRTSWQQNIRSMYRHRDALERVIVLPSAESLAQFDDFARYAKALFGDTRPALTVELVTARAGTQEPFFVSENGRPTRSYESYDYVRRGLRRALEQAGYPTAVSADEICIDATAGQKTFSIAAAIVTLNESIKFSYVTTGDGAPGSGGEVRFYDARVRFVRMAGA